ncbi:uncharacterized protein LOC113380706 [Ctenocephalides felis]|uniref:uncharacterized protein LOC113380706 n=1 Tax=Ctenocephalides felis TaxID=7515 RepID=UPI000E6E173D|nr:uncharacterized protein LOC113380706 [Ctenocephalides felis]
MAFFGIIWAADSRRRRYRQRYALRYLRDADNMGNLIELLEPHAETHTASWSIPFYLQVLAALHFFGHGSYQTDVGNCHLNSMSQPSVSRCIKTVTDLIIKHATPKYVNFPKTSSERDENKKRYMLHHFVYIEHGL